MKQMFNLIVRIKLNRRISLIGCSCLLVFQVTVLSPVRAAEADSQTDAEERLDEVIAEHRYQHERDRLGEKSNDWLAEFVIGLFIPDRITIHANVFSGGGSFARTPVAVGALLPFAVPKSLVERDVTKGKFLDYPYQANRSGNMITYTAKEWLDNPLMSEGWEGNQMRIQTDYSWNSKASAVNTRLLLEGAGRIGLRGSFDYRRDVEMIADYNGQDDFWIGDMAVTYRFAQSDVVQLRAGGGFMWFSDGMDADIGWNFLYEVDWYLKDPWVVNASLNLGALHFQKGRSSAPVVNFRTTIGYQRKRIQVYIGFQHLQIGNDERDAFISGLQWSF